MVIEKELIEKAKEKLGDENATIIAELLDLEKKRELFIEVVIDD